MPLPRPSYRLLDHTADLAFAAEAPDFAGVLAAATAALSDLILRTDDAPSDRSVPVAVTGADAEDVLVAWLTEVLILLETQGVLARTARLEEATATAARGVLWGRRLDPATQPPDRVVKAVTYHDLRVVPGDTGRPWRATVVLDL